MKDVVELQKRTCCLRLASDTVVEQHTDHAVGHAVSDGVTRIHTVGCLQYGLWGEQKPKGAEYL